MMPDPLSCVEGVVKLCLTSIVSVKYVCTSGISSCSDATCAINFFQFVRNFKKGAMDSFRNYLYYNDSRQQWNEFQSEVEPKKEVYIFIFGCAFYMCTYNYWQIFYNYNQGFS